jgi:hypothetical protein
VSGLDLDAIEQRAKAATSDVPPGFEWQSDDSGGVYCGGYATYGPFESRAIVRAMGEFAAHAHQDVPALVAAIREVLVIHSTTTVVDGVELCDGCVCTVPCATVRALS